MRLNISHRPPYILGMANSRKSPQDTLKIHRLPKKGQTVRIEAEIVRVDAAEGTGHDRVTFRIAGYPIPVTIDARHLADADDA
jgi:hypothetical protein